MFKFLLKANKKPKPKDMVMCRVCRGTGTVMSVDLGMYQPKFQTLICKECKGLGYKAVSNE